MKMILVLAAALSLAACAQPTNPSPGTGIVAKADQVVLTAERGFAVAEIAYTVAANNTARLIEQGTIRGDAVARIRALNVRARQLLVEGKATADTARRATAAAELFNVIAQFEQER